LNQVSDFDDLSEENKEKVMKERYKKLIDMFTDRDLTLPLALCEVAPVGEIDDVAQVILNIFHSNRELTLSLIKTVVEKEIIKTESPANLFRRNSMATRLLTIFAKQQGNEYLKRTLQPYMIKLVTDSVDKSYEIDPTKIEYGDKVTNLENLKNACQGFVDAITNSQNIPLCFVELCTFIAKVVGEKFQVSPLPAVGGFVFLRFFCPAIVSPDGNLVSIPQSKELRRGLVLCTKIIQNLANNVLFGVKENFMVELNEFLKSNISQVTSFLKRISGSDGNGLIVDYNYYGDVDAPIDPNDIDKLHHYLVEYQEKIERVGKEMVNRKNKYKSKNTPYSNNQNASSNANLVSNHSSNEDLPGRNDREIRSMKKTFEQFTSLINQLGPPPEINEIQTASTYINKTGVISQLFIEFLQRNEHKNVDAVKDSKVFYEGGISKERNTVFYLIARRIPIENDDIELLLYYFFTVIKPYFGKPYEIVIDCSFFDIGNEVKSNIWIKLLSIFPPEAFENLYHIYLYNVTTVFKKWSKQFAKNISSRILKKMICVTFTSELNEYISYSELKLPKSTVMLEKDIITSFTPVIRITHYKSRNQVVLKINKDSIIITTVKKQELFGIPCIFNDVIQIS